MGLVFAPSLAAGKAEAAGKRSFYSNKVSGIAADLSQDARSKLQSLLNAARDNGGGNVIITPGDYRLDHQLRVYNNTHLTLMAGAWLYRNWTTDNPDWGDATVVNDACPSQKSYIVGVGSFQPASWNTNISIDGAGGFSATPEAVLQSRSSGVYCGPNIALMAVRNMTLGGGLQLLSSKNCWNVAIHAEHAQISNLRIRGGQNLFEDGIHIVAGTDLSIENCYIESGDDSIAFGTGYNQSISDVIVKNVVVRSNKAYALKFVQNRAGLTRDFPAPDQNIRNITVRNLRGAAGLHRNGLVSIITSPALPDLVADLDLQVDLRHGNVFTHDGVAPHGLDMQGGARVKISGRFHNVIQRNVFIRQNAEEVTIDLVCDAPQINGIEPVAVLDAKNVSLSGTFPCHGGNAAYAKNVANLRLQKFVANDIPTGCGILRIDGATSVFSSDSVGTKASGATDTYAYRVSPGADATITSSRDNYSNLGSVLASGSRPRSMRIGKTGRGE